MIVRSAICQTPIGLPGGPNHHRQASLVGLIVAGRQDRKNGDGTNEIWTSSPFALKLLSKNRQVNLVGARTDG